MIEHIPYSRKYELFFNKFDFFIIWRCNFLVSWFDHNFRSLWLVQLFNFYFINWFINIFFDMHLYFQLFTFGLLEDLGQILSF
jgi:hypothetical protein